MLIQFTSLERDAAVADAIISIANLVVILIVIAVVVVVVVIIIIIIIIIQIINAVIESQMMKSSGFFLE